MKAYRIRYRDGSFKIVVAKDMLEVIKKYDLATKENFETMLTELSGEQEAIAFSQAEEENE